MLPFSEHRDLPRPAQKRTFHVLCQPDISCATYTRGPKRLMPSGNYDIIGTMSEQSTISRKNWKARVFRPEDRIDIESEDIKYWVSIPVDERTEAAWQLSLELWMLSSQNSKNEQRFHRVASRIIRR